MPLQYGKQLTVTKEGDVTSMHEELFVNFSTVKSLNLFTETVRIKDEKDLLSEFLKLLDRQKAGEIDLIGIQMLRNKETGALRAEKTWVVY